MQEEKEARMWQNEGLRKRGNQMTRWEPVQELNLFRFLPDSMFGVDDDVQLAGIKQDGSQTKEPQE